MSWRWRASRALGVLVRALVRLELWLGDVRLWILDGGWSFDESD